MDRDAILRALEGIGAGAGSAEVLSEKEFFRGLYPVANQARTFELDRVVVVGGRGTGKTQIFRALLSKSGREAVVAATGVRLAHDVSRLLLVEGFGAGRSFREGAPPHPPSDAIDAALSGGDIRTARKLWLGLSLARLAIDEVVRPQLPKSLGPEMRILAEHVGSPKRLLDWVEQDVERPFRMLDALDRHLANLSLACVFTFDALDRAANDWSTLEVVVGGLLSLALDVLRRSRALRLKVFLRPDLESGGTHRFPDASKLRGYREELVWSKPDLFRLAFKRMVAQEDGGEEVYRYLKPLVGSRAFTPIEPLGLTPTVALDEAAQEEVLIAMVGKYMGANPRKGLTYTWIPNHLADAMGRVSPRSFLVAFADAARWSRPRPDTSRILSPTALSEGVKAASVQRVEELAEDFDWIREVARRLEDLEVPCPEVKVLQRLQECVFPDPLPASLRSAEPSVVLQQLLDMGVFLRSRDGRYNVPDLYRVAMKMKRRGGIKLAH